MERKTIKVTAAVILKDRKVFATQRGYGTFKDWWEFPGGKIEPGETPTAALKREIREELNTRIGIDRYLVTVEYDYPEFHLSMDCFLCHVEEGDLTLLEHEAAKWLPMDNLRQVKWLPADIRVLEAIEEAAKGEEESDCRKWALQDPMLTIYHDHEWCRISHDDRYIFEMLCLEGQSTGLSWRTIINKREAYKAAFFNFDIAKCAEMTDAYLDSLLDNPLLIRNKNKIYSVRNNAVSAMKIIREYGSLDSFFWAYTGGKQIVGNWKRSSDMPAKTDISEKMSKDLKKLGMSFVGPVITYSFMQSIGMVNDHLADCRFK